MEEQVRNPMHDGGLALGLIVAFLFYGPVYVAYSGVRNVAARCGQALRPA